MKRPILLILAVQFVLGLVFMASTPAFEASDEIWHYPFVRHLALGGSLPVQTPGVATPWQQEGSQPPLYYALGAALTGWMDTSDYEQAATPNPFGKLGVPGTTDNVNLVRHVPGQRPWQSGTLSAVYLIRLASLLMAVGTVYLTYRLALTVFPRRLPLALLAAALVAFNPMFLFIGASVNNDNLAVLLATLALWLLTSDLDAPERGMRWRRTLVLGLVLALAALSKLSGAVLLPVSAFVVTVSAWRERSWRIWFGRGALLVGMVALVGGWWYVRNLQLYGELFGIERMSIIAGRRPEGFGLADLWGERLGFWYSFWGVFGGFNLLAPPWYLAAVTLLTVVAVAGVVFALGRRLRTGGAVRWSMHATLLLFLVLSFTGVVNWTLKTTASQGRLMFAGIAPISLYLALGLLAWVPRSRRAAAAGIGAAALAAAAGIIALTTILPAYRPLQPVASLPAEAQPLDIRFGDSVRLIGYKPANEPVAPGQPFDVTLYWTAAQTPESAPRAADLNLALNGFGYAGDNVAKIDTWPGGGLLPTSLWQPGVIYPDSYRMMTEPDADAPARVGLNVSFWQDTLENQLPIRQDGRDVTFVMLPMGDLVPAAQPLATTSPLATLDHGIRLLSYEAAQEGGALNLRLFWDTTAAIPADYTTFVHLVDANGAIAAQSDSPPRQGSWPTSAWRPGGVVPSDHTLDLPPGLPSGDYRLRVGFYAPETGVRLAASGADGQPLRDNAVELGPVTLAAP